MTKPTARHGLAGRLLRLPHVVPRHGRAPARDRRAGRPRLQPAGRRQGLPGGRRRLPGRGRGLQRGRPGTRSRWSASGRRRWSRSATARSPPTSPGCATRSGQATAGAGLPRERHAQPADPARGRAALLPTARPVHRVVQVDVFLPGLPAVGRPHLRRAGRPARRARHAGHARIARFGR